MTRKLFYEDPNLAEFSAKVVSCEKENDRWAIVLGATAFYPEGGGQAADVGTLGVIKVLDTRERGEEVVHFCDAPLDVGTEVCGRIDWAHRFDLMQQHTGEHILSGILHARFGYQNVGFHVGADVMEVDFDGPLTPEDIAWAELEANKAIWEDIPVKCWFPTQEELPNVTYRSKRALPWPVRIVQVPGFDSCACCGIHVKTTGQVGLIKILSCVKFHQGVRLEMVCGQRAYRYISGVFDQNKQISQMFSAKILETAAAARKVSDALAAEKMRSATLEKQVLSQIAESYANCDNVLHFENDLSGAALRELAEQISHRCSGVAAVFTGEDGRYSYCLASKNQDLRILGKEMTAALNGRGGGKAEFQQGTVAAMRGQIEEFFDK
ncbi:MAG: alanyl-tRNA editing protein [Oscillospiraceae bacterium]|nr:alanyl-tRNA editing protein [Oscillospiraceae bacterium]